MNVSLSSAGITTVVTDVPTCYPEGPQEVSCPDGTSVNGTNVEGPSDLQRIIASTPVGQTVKLMVMRDGKPAELSVTIGPYQGPTGLRPTPRRTP